VRFKFKLAVGQGPGNRVARLRLLSLSYSGIGTYAHFSRSDHPANFMSFWRRLFGRQGNGTLSPKRLDYLNEALALERQGDYKAALTSYRLALRDNPTDPRILQNMAIAFTKTGLMDDAVRHYRKALELDGDLVGAHYGIAFLLRHQGQDETAARHLRAFLAQPPKGPDADRWIRHAQDTLKNIEENPAPEPS
jgi:tetratricopeptide (TPR) repeat protein